MAQIAVDVRVRAKLPRWYPVFLRLCRLAGYLGWNPSEARAKRIAAWVARRSDVEVLQGDPEVVTATDRDNSTQGLDALH